MSTITEAQAAAITARLAEIPHLAAGLGTEDEPCSVAAINLALTGELSEDIPGCMSEVIGRWIIRIQDAMPADLRNSAEWRALLPLAAGTGRDPATEEARLELIGDWMWSALALAQPTADRFGFGVEWEAMCATRTIAAADAAAARADAAADAAYARAYAYADAADAAAYAADAADAADAAAYAAARAADAAAYAAAAYAAAARAYAYADAAAARAYAGALDGGSWEPIDPARLLARLVAPTHQTNQGDQP
jgi:hypothetical protein